MYFLLSNHKYKRFYFAAVLIVLLTVILVSIYSGYLRNKNQFKSSFMSNQQIITSVNSNVADLDNSKLSLKKNDLNKNISMKVMDLNKNEQSLHRGVASEDLNKLKINGLDYKIIVGYSGTTSKLNKNKNIETISGYSVTKSDTQAVNISKFDPQNLLIVSRPSSNQKKIITGNFVLKLDSFKNYKKIPEDLNLLVEYEAPQINLLILKAKAGQNIFQILEILKKNKNVKEARLEIIGEGVRAQ